MASSVRRNQIIFFLATLALPLTYYVFNTGSRLTTKRGEAYGEISARVPLPSKLQPVGVGNFFVAACKKCLNETNSGQCDQSYGDCVQRPDFGLNGNSTVSQLATQLITRCAEAHIVSSRDSIQCTGVHAIRNCQTEFKCNLMDELTVSILGVSISIAQEVQDVLNENDLGPTRGANIQSQSIAQRDLKSQESQQADESLDMPYQGTSVRPAEGDMLRTDIREGRVGIDIDSVNVNFSESDPCDQRLLRKRTQSDRAELIRKSGSNPSGMKVSDQYRMSKLICEPVPNHGPNRTPMAVEITISGTQLTRREIVVRATEKLKQQNGFKSLFSADIQVKTVAKVGGKFRYIVKFDVFT